MKNGLTFRENFIAWGGLIGVAVSEYGIRLICSLAFWALIAGFALGRWSAPTLARQAQARKDAAQMASFVLRQMADQIDQSNPR